MSPLQQLRNKMEEYGVDVYLIVSDDFHASEYVGDYFKCREYISGFNGSAGSVVVTKTEAGLWTDGRYFLQAEAQLQGSGITLYKMGEENVLTIAEYLTEILNSGQVLAYDGRTLSFRSIDKIKKELKKADKQVKYLENVDLVGEIWENRPAFPNHPIWSLKEEQVGRSRKQKLFDLRQKMKEKQADYHLIASLDDIAWLYNIRGNDIAYNPVAMAYTLVDAKGEHTVLYCNGQFADDGTKTQLLEDGILIKPYFQIYTDLEHLTEEEFCPQSKSELSIMVDKNTTNVALISKIPEKVRLIYEDNPTTIAKAVKTPVEMENERKAHIKDGVAVTKLIYLLKNVQYEEAFQQGEITELTVAEKLLQLRKQQDGFIEESFAPIIASGEHGAIVHYEADESTDVPIATDTFLLMDTGGQYYEGTTDITRTVVIGKVNPQQKAHYTAVLRGNLNLANAYFKKGVTGANLDYLARSPLWEYGLDYNHGTGHGVGYLLNVHEGPNAIRLKQADKTVGVELEEGMITSDEPGLYLEGRYGIRLENLILCLKDKKTDMGQFMKFETLTMVPFDVEAIDTSLMSEREVSWLNQYHELVYLRIAKYLTQEERQWLYKVTRPLVKKQRGNIV